VSESTRLTNEQLAGLFDLSGKTAVVTGAAGVLGGFLAKGLALYGADVCLTDVGLPGMAPVVAEIESFGRRAIMLNFSRSSLAIARGFLGRPVRIPEHAATFILLQRISRSGR